MGQCWEVGGKLVQEGEAWADTHSATSTPAPSLCVKVLWMQRLEPCQGEWGGSHASCSHGGIAQHHASHPHPLESSGHLSHLTVSPLSGQYWAAAPACDSGVSLPWSSIRREGKSDGPVWVRGPPQVHLAGARVLQGQFGAGLGAGGVLRESCLPHLGWATHPARLVLARLLPGLSLPSLSSLERLSLAQKAAWANGPLLTFLIHF